MSDQDEATSHTDAERWRLDYERDRPLHTQFPLKLLSGKSIPGLHIVCAGCGSRLSGDAIRGRVTEWLPHVVSVAANGMCIGCARITHIDCRFRTDREDTIVEWLGSGGRWQARPMRPRSLRVRLGDAVRRLWTRLWSRSS
jgi:hypothetical protein